MCVLVGSSISPEEILTEILNQAEGEFMWHLLVAKSKGETRETLRGRLGSKVYFGSPLITLRKSSIPHAGNV